MYKKLVSFLICISIFSQCVVFSADVENASLNMLDSSIYDVDAYYEEMWHQVELMLFSETRNGYTLINDEGHLPYPYLVDELKDNKWVDVCSDLTDQSLTVERYTEIIVNLMAIINANTADFIEAQAEIDTIKTVGDYFFDVTDIVVGAIGIDARISANVTSEMKMIADGMGLTWGLTELTLDTIDEIQYFDATFREYEQYILFLSSIEKYASDDNLIKAARNLTSVTEKVFYAKISSAVNLMESGAEFIGVDVFFENILLDQLTNNPDKFGLSADEVFAANMLDNAYTMLLSANLSVDLGVFISDMLIGASDILNRYNEMEALYNIRTALKSQFNNDVREISRNDVLNGEAHDLVYEIRELMMLILYVDYRGTYCYHQMVTRDAQLLTLVCQINGSAASADVILNQMKNIVNDSMVSINRLLPKREDYTLNATYEYYMAEELEKHGEILVWEYHDYDRDGVNEAYAMVSSKRNDTIDSLYYVDRSLEPKCMVDSFNIKYSDDLNPHAYVTQNAMVFYYDTGTRYDLQTIVYSVCEGNPYELDISKIINGFWKTNNSFYTMKEIQIIGGGVGYEQLELLYDPVERQFKLPDSIIDEELVSGIAWSIDGSTLTISGKGEIDSYISEDPPWKDYRDNITKLIIKNGITSIGWYAFSDCKLLQEVTLPDSLTSIGWYAFSGCTSLKSITLPDSLTNIGNRAFAYCSSLISISIPDSVTDISNLLFRGCTSLQTIILHDKITSIGYGAFENCKSLQEVKLSDSIISINFCAFLGCTSIKAITIPQSVKEIGEHAFEQWTSDQTIYIEGRNSAPEEWHYGWSEQCDAKIVWDPFDDTINDDCIYNENLMGRIPRDAVQFNGNYYYLFYLDEITTWADASAYCESLNGHLATITSKEEDDFLYNYLLQLDENSAYFGFTDQGHEGTWTWVTGENTEYTNWYYSEPNSETINENFGMYYWKYSNGHWNDGEFNRDIAPFFCEWENQLAQVQFEGGNGTIEEPYKVSTPEQLNAVRYDLSANYIQINDIDMSSYGSFTPIGMGLPSYSTTLLNPIEIEVNPFNGSYDGGNYTITNLTINESSLDCVGLFSACSDDSIIQNVKLVNATMIIDKEDTDYTAQWKEGNVFSISAGIIAGYSTGKIRNCNVSGSIRIMNCNDATVGGILGWGNVDSCVNNADIYILSNKDSRYVDDGDVRCGGIVGSSNTINGTISRCINYADIFVIAGNSIKAGGISGDDGSITYCVNYGNIEATVYSPSGYSSTYETASVGGIFGSSSSDNTSNCVNLGSCKASIYGENVGNFVYQAYVGGIGGHSGFYGSGIVTDCYNGNSSIISIKAQGDDINGFSEIQGYAGRIIGGLGGYLEKNKNNYSLEDTLLNNQKAVSELSDTERNGGTISKTDFDNRLDEILKNIDSN